MKNIARAFTLIAAVLLLVAATAEAEGVGSIGGYGAPAPG